MSVLKNIENKLAGIVEGTFSRAFRSEVRPVEIARKLAKEMEEHQSLSVSRVYVPNEYAVYLSKDDRRRFGDYEQALGKELSGYLLEHARREKLALLARPTVEFRTDDRLRLGEFGIQARMVEPPEEERGKGRQGEVGNTMIYSAVGSATDEHLEERRSAPGTALLLVAGKRMALSGSQVVIGRSREADIVVDDPNISRKHATVSRSGASWVIEDLGSTNGVLVNGRRIGAAQPLNPGDRIELGTSMLTYEEER
jgi:FhaA, N-terminal domain/FHA domain